MSSEHELVETMVAKAKAQKGAENFRTLYVDPGEDTGWCLARGFTLLAAGTEKLWTFADEVWAELNEQPSILSDPSFIRNEVDPEENSGQIKRIVCEDFRLYPWELKNMAWDQVRTARLIGALTFMARQKQISFVLQPAAIKKAAMAAGAEEYYYRPLHENRHQNDAIQHYVFFTQTQLAGVSLPVKLESDHA